MSELDKLELNQEVFVRFVVHTVLQGKIYDTQECYYKCRIIALYKDTNYIAVEIIEMPNYGTQVIVERKNNELLFESEVEMPTILEKLVRG